MVLFNYSTRELTAKVVYYGPGLCGKTTNLQYIHENLPENVKGKMLSLATKTDRTLFFDFLPIDLGEIRGMKTRVQLYTVPGQVFYNETRKLVLKGADGIVFVADSQETMLGANAESFKNLEENLKGHGMRLADMPHVIQFNKRDLPRLSPIEDLNAAINRYNAPFYESVAVTGIGVQDTLKAIVKLVLLHLTRKYDPKSSAAPSPSPSASVVVPAMPPAPAAPVLRAAAPVTAVPLSRMDAPVATPVARAAAPPPPPDFRAPAAAAAAVEEEAALGRFDEDEIDGIMAEVEDAYEPPAEVPVAVIEAAAPAVPDDAVWMGAPEEESSPFAAPDAAFGSTLSLDELADAVEARQAAQPAPAEPAFAPPPRFGDFPEERFEIDRGFDPEWAAPVEPVAPAPAPVPTLRVPVRAPEPVLEPEPFSGPAFAESTMTADVAALFGEPPAALEPLAEAEVEVEVEPQEPEAAPPQDEPIVLTEVAEASDLFDDPNLEVANLAPGEAREIVVPVQLGEGPALRRFALSIRLRLDPVEPR